MNREVADASQPTGTLATAIEHAEALLMRDPRLAEAQAREVLVAAPGHPAALRILGEALGLQGCGQQAIEALRQATSKAPDDAEAWRLLAEQLLMTDDTSGADAATAAMLQASTRSPGLVEAAIALNKNRLAEAEAQLRDRLRDRPTDVAALRMLAELAARLGRDPDAERILAHALMLAPEFAAARANLAQVYHRQGKSEEALAHLEVLTGRDPKHPGYRAQRAAVLARIGDTEGAIAVYAALLADHPNQPKIWMSYAHALKAIGRVDASVAAYRTSLRQLPSLGEAWWSLANLKTFVFDQADVDIMMTEQNRTDLSAESRYHIDFALGKAFEDRADYKRSFDHYQWGNALRKVELNYDPEEIANHVRRSRVLFTAQFFAERQGVGTQAPDPIFIVGLPRSGSTLLEQILSSHSRVEGTSELSAMLSIVSRLGGRPDREGKTLYPEVIASLSADVLKTLGDEYIAKTRLYRRTNKPLFIDKMPNNFQHIGLIKLILPHAKIVDVRRHPLATGFAGFKQHFARGQGFTYSLSDIGKYYADYFTLLSHYDRVLPGSVHRVVYEKLVADPEKSVRSILAFCGLNFEDNCLRFYETKRSVLTPSAEQVRQPIYTDAIDQWRHYERWLGPLKEALGPIINQYETFGHY